MKNNDRADKGHGGTQPAGFRKRMYGVISLSVLFIALICLMLVTGRINGKVPDNSHKQNSENAGSQVYNADHLFEYRTRYVGDHSKVLHILDNLQFANYRGTISLQTDKAPYGVTVNYDFSELIEGDIQKAKIENQKRMKLALRRNAALMYCLIDNVENLTFNCYYGDEPIVYSFARSEIQKDYDEELRSYSKDKNKFGSFVISFNDDNLILHSMSKYTPAMSSVPGMKITSTYEGEADQVRYTTTNGQLLTWDKSIVKSHGKSVTLPLKTPVYWSPYPADNTESFKEGTAAFVKSEALNNGIRVAEQSLNVKSDKMFYTVVEDINIIADVR